MKKYLTTIFGILVIISAICLGLSSKEANDCTCGDYSVYQPKLFILNIQTYLHYDGKLSTLCEPTEGCRVRAVPVFVDLYLLGGLLTAMSFIKRKRSR